MKKHFLFAIVALAFSVLSLTASAQNHIRIEFTNYYSVSYGGGPPMTWSLGTQYFADVSVKAYDSSWNPIPVPSGVVYGSDDILNSTYPDYRDGSIVDSGWNWDGTSETNVLVRDEHTSTSRPGVPATLYSLYTNGYGIRSAPSGYTIDPTVIL